MYNTEISELTFKLCNTAEKHFGNHGYAAGYFASLLSTHFDKMPEDVQQMIKWQLESTIETYSEYLGEK